MIIIAANLVDKALEWRLVGYLYAQLTTYVPTCRTRTVVRGGRCPKRRKLAASSFCEASPPECTHDQIYKIRPSIKTTPTNKQTKTTYFHEDKYKIHAKYLYA